MVDSGSSSNFIREEFAMRQGLPLVQLDKEQMVQLADGTEYRVKKGIVNASVRWDGWSGRETLLALPLRHYDVILGMSWLKNNNPHIDWRTGRFVADRTGSARIGDQPSASEAKHQLSSLASDCSMTHDHDQQLMPELTATGSQMDSSVGIGRGVLGLMTAREWQREIRNGGEGGLIYLRRTTDKTSINLNTVTSKPL